MFAGLKVLELASVLAGPSVGQFFAELGADVIKVESPQGDVTRSWKSAGEPEGDRSAYFCCCNWGKKSVVIDLRTAEGKSTIVKLAATCDIILASYKPGDAEKLGVDYGTLAKNNPTLIYGMITGYGAKDERVGYDAVIQAESGFMDLNGEPGGPPLKMPVALIDVLAAHQLKEALLLAMIQLDRTGKGSFVQVSLMEVALSSLANQGSNWLVGGREPVRQGSAHPNIAPYGDVFETKDGKRLMLAVGNDRQFEELAQLLGGSAEWRAPTFRTNQQRVMNRQLLSRLLAAEIGKRTSADLIESLTAKKIPAGLLQTVKEAVSTVDNLLTSGGFRGLRTFAGKSEIFSERALSPPPRLGEHTNEVLGMIH